MLARGSLPFAKRIPPLFPISGRHWMAVDAVSLWPAILRQVMGAENPIQPREVNGKIHINGFLFDAVMPVMKARCDEPAIKPLEFPSDVGMSEGGHEIDDQDVGIDGIL